MFKTPAVLKKLQKKIEVYQRRLSRKQKTSKNRRKAKLAFALAWERLTNIRKDFIHKSTTQLVCDNQVDTVVIEDLNVEGMKRNHKLARSISNAVLSEIHRQLRYKAEWSGRNIVQIDRWFPSSRLCSDCGQINEDLTLSDREWICSCGEEHDRDMNAAINIRDEGLRMSLGAEGTVSSINKGLRSDEPIQVEEILLASTSNEADSVNLTTSLVC